MKKIFQKQSRKNTSALGERSLDSLEKMGGREREKKKERKINRKIVRGKEREKEREREREGEEEERREEMT